MATATVGWAYSVGFNFLPHSSTYIHRTTHQHTNLVLSKMTGCYGNQASVLDIRGILAVEKVVTQLDHIRLQGEGEGREGKGGRRKGREGRGGEVGREGKGGRRGRD